MSGRVKTNPRYEVISFRTTKEQREILDKARGQSSVSSFVDLLLTLYLQGQNDGTAGMGHEMGSGTVRA